MEEIKDNAKLGNMRWESIRIEKVEEIIRSHMDDLMDIDAEEKSILCTIGEAGASKRRGCSWREVQGERSRWIRLHFSFCYMPWVQKIKQKNIA